MNVHLRKWLYTVYNTGYGHGNDLSVALSLAGCGDNTARANDLIAWALDQGYLLRGSDQPTREQLFFMEPGVINNRNVRCGWAPNRDNWRLALLMGARPDFVIQLRECGSYVALQEAFRLAHKAKKLGLTRP